MEPEEEEAGIEDGRGPHRKNEPVKSTDGKYPARVTPRMPKGENVPRQATEADVLSWLIPLSKPHCLSSVPLFGEFLM